MLTREKIIGALNNATKITKYNLKDFTHKFPLSNTEKGIYGTKDNTGWTTGFWTGTLWLSYEYTKDEEFKKVANIQVDTFLERIEKEIEVDHHDMGFLFSLSCVASYKLTGNEIAKEAALKSADHLMKRFQEKGQFFQAWGELGTADNYRLIIDCLLNMPLLFWASEVTENKNYANKAEAHIKTAMNYVVREDNSTYHTYFFDPETGKATRGVTHQGNRDGSAWSRGQAWGVYGAALSYKVLRDPEYIEIFRKVTDYFYNHLPKDLIPYWDFDFTDGSEEPRDSSASAIVVCGIMEMCKYLEKEEAEKYMEMADKMLEALIDKCSVKSIEDSNALLLHGTYARDTPNNPCSNRGVDEANVWGDYFYLEALMRKYTDWELYW